MLNDNHTAELSSYSESAMCVTVFRVLKSVVASWLRDISVHRNVFADFQGKFICHKFIMYNINKMATSFSNSYPLLQMAAQPHCLALCKHAYYLCINI
jgi:hypothetical protein